MVWEKTKESGLGWSTKNQTEDALEFLFRMTGIGSPHGHIVINKQTGSPIYWRDWKNLTASISGNEINVFLLP